jgi:hypothetical protein
MKTLLILSALLVSLVTGCDPTDRALAAESPHKPAERATNVALASVSAAPNSASTNTPASADPLSLPPLPPELPAPVQEVVQLAQNTLGEQVLIDFVATIATPYSLTVEHVIFLKDLGVADSVIAALLKRQVALGGAALQLPPEPDVAGNLAPDTQAPTEAKLALTNAPGADVGLASVPAPAPQSVPYAPTQGETPALAPAPAAEPATTVNYNVFYQSLSPYGTWVEVGDYGWCWQPTVSTISVGWRPYSDNGRWIWSSSGWYWHSHYSWGWAPFHYGRWCNVPARGWCWVPGTVWGPSWVSWRHSNDHFGWAPLPPACGWATGVGLTYHGAGISVGFSFGLGASDYCFVPRHRFYDPHCYRFRAPRHELVGLYHRSSVVNNYVVGNNNTVIINQGVGREVIQKHTREEIRPVALANARQPGKASELALRPGGRAERLEVYRPALAASAAASRPPAAVLARQEARPQPSASRLSGGAGSLGVANNPNSNRPGATPAGRNDGSSLGSGRQEIRTGGSDLPVSSRNVSSANRPTAVPRREIQPTTSPRGSQVTARPETRIAAPASGTPAAAAQLHGRSESRPSVVAPRTEISAPRAPQPTIARPTETRPVTSYPGTPANRLTGQLAPIGSSSSSTRPVSSRAESRPTPQTQLPVRRDTPAPANPPVSSRPDLGARYQPAPTARPQPAFPSSQPAAQPRFEARPQAQPATQAPRTGFNSAPPARSYSPPAASNQGGGGDRSGSSRPASPRTQPQ